MTPLDKNIDLFGVENSIVKNIIKSSTSIDDVVNKIVTNDNLNFTEKLASQTVVFGFNELLMTFAVNQTFDAYVLNETMEVPPEDALCTEEAREAYNAYMVTFVEHYQPTGKFGDSIT